MKQNGTEKDDPLRRIQEEINEVARRERELRQTMLHQENTPSENGDPISVNNSGDSIDEACNCAVVDKEHSDDQHSEDSGISASSSPVNGTSANDKKYIRPNGFNIVPYPPPQTVLSRAVSTPHIFIPNRRIIYPSQKGIMQRFIASRGKLPGHTTPNPSPIAVNGTGPVAIKKDVVSNETDPLARTTAFIPPVTIDPASIIGSVPNNGRPIRRGYVPVEEKIQKELRDLKNRESELKRMRKLDSRQSQPNLLSSIEDEEFVSDEDSDVEHCYPPGKWRSTKSISELCDAMNSTSTSTSRTTPSPNFEEKSYTSHNGGGMRPAVSLAQLCDLNPEEAPSSHQLIAKWESLIQRNAS